MGTRPAIKLNVLSLPEGLVARTTGKFLFSGSEGTQPENSQEWALVFREVTPRRSPCRPPRLSGRLS